MVQMKQVHDPNKINACTLLYGSRTVGPTLMTRLVPGNEGRSTAIAYIAIVG